jgi:8-oxo-dGTP pyrophosphatase MutT (NUDIX family)
MMDGSITVHDTLFRGRVVRIEAASVQLPGGNVAEYQIVRHPGSAAVVAMDAQHRVCLLRQFRPATGGWIWELPAGRREPDEQPEQTARRELTEEAGCQADSWHALGSILSSPGFCSEEIHLFLATGLTAHPTHHESYEAIEIHWIDFDVALQRALTGEVRDAKSVVGLVLAREHLAHGKTPPERST